MLSPFPFCLLDEADTYYDTNRSSILCTARRILPQGQHQKLFLAPLAPDMADSMPAMVHAVAVAFGERGHFLIAEQSRRPPSGNASGARSQGRGGRPDLRSRHRRFPRTGIGATRAVGTDAWSPIKWFCRICARGTTWPNLAPASGPERDIVFVPSCALSYALFFAPTPLQCCISMRGGPLLLLSLDPRCFSHRPMPLRNFSFVSITRRATTKSNDSIEGTVGAVIEIELV